MSHLCASLRLLMRIVIDCRGDQVHLAVGRELGLPLVVLHSPTDATVGIENTGEIFRTARHPFSFVSLEAKHLLNDPGQAVRAARILGAWALRHLCPESDR